MSETFGMVRRESAFMNNFFYQKRLNLKKTFIFAFNYDSLHNMHLYFYLERSFHHPDFRTFKRIFLRNLCMTFGFCSRQTRSAGTASISSSLRSCGAFSSCCSRRNRHLPLQPNKMFVF